MESSEKYALRACQIWSVLALAAMNRQTLTYEKLHELTAIHHRNSQSYPLGVIKHYCIDNKLPILTVLVVKTKIGKPSSIGLEEVNNFDKEREKVFDFDRGWKNPGFDVLAKTSNKIHSVI